MRNDELLLLCLVNGYLLTIDNKICLNTKTSNYYYYYYRSRLPTGRSVSPHLFHRSNTRSIDDIAAQVPAAHASNIMDNGFLRARTSTRANTTQWGRNNQCPKVPKWFFHLNWPFGSLISCSHFYTYLRIFTFFIRCPEIPICDSDIEQQT